MTTRAPGTGWSPAMVRRSHLSIATIFAVHDYDFAVALK